MDIWMPKNNTATFLFFWNHANVVYRICRQGSRAFHTRGKADGKLSRLDESDVLWRKTLNYSIPKSPTCIVLLRLRNYFGTFAKLKIIINLTFCDKNTCSLASAILNYRWVSDLNRNPNNLAYYILLSYFHSIKIAKLYVIMLRDCVQTT